MFPHTFLSLADDINYYYYYLSDNITRAECERFLFGKRFRPENILDYCYLFIYATGETAGFSRLIDQRTRKERLKNKNKYKKKLYKKIPIQ